MMAFSRSGVHYP